MATLLERLQEEKKQAMKNKDAVTKDTLTYVLAKAQGKAKEKLVELSDSHILEAVKSEIKLTEEAVAMMANSLTPEKASNYNKQITILKSFLPKQLSRDEVSELITKVMEEKSIEKSPKSMGIVIKEVKQVIGDAIDGKTLSDLVKLALT